MAAAELVTPPRGSALAATFEGLAKTTVLGSSRGRSMEEIPCSIVEYFINPDALV
jgi:hypothetical protein